MRPFVFPYSLRNPLKFAILVVGLGCFLSTQSLGQDSPKKAYENLVKANKEKNWEKMFGMLTQQASDQLFNQMIQMAFQFKSAAFSLPNSKDLQPELDKLFTEYKIDDFKYPQPEFLGGRIPDKEAILEYQKKAEKAAKEIVKKIGMRKFDFLQRLDKIMSKSPFGNFTGMMFNGDLKEIEVKGDGATAVVKVNSKDLDLGGAGGAIQIEIPPIPVKFSKVKNKWKFDGVDEEKALERMEKDLPDVPKVELDF